MKTFLFLHNVKGHKPIDSLRDRYAWNSTFIQEVDHKIAKRNEIILSRGIIKLQLWATGEHDIPPKHLNLLLLNMIPIAFQEWCGKSKVDENYVVFGEAIILKFAFYVLEHYVLRL